MSKEPEPGLKQDELLAFVRARIKKGGIPPSRAEMAEHLQVTVSRVTTLLNILHKAGKVELDSRVSWLTLPGFRLRPNK